jgi:hypothetical protein
MGACRWLLQQGHHQEAFGGSLRALGEAEAAEQKQLISTALLGTAEVEGRAPGWADGPVSSRGSGERSGCGFSACSEGCVDK